MSNNLLLFFMLMLLSACSHQSVKVLNIQAVEQLPSLAAEFETTVIYDNAEPQYYQWRFWRSTNRIETRNLQDNSGEVWQKQAKGNIEYERLFHDQQQAIDYLPGDLNAIGAQPDWLALSTLVNQSMILTLHADSHEQVMDRSGIHYKSNDPNQSLEVIWLEHEQLPALIKRIERGHTLITRITSIYSLLQSPWPYQHSTDYRHTDFSDIGDKENDPFIKSILHKLKGGHGHQDNSR